MLGKKVLIGLVAVMIAFSGCVQPQTPEMKIAQSQYKAMTKAFLAKLPKYEELYRTKSDQIVLKYYVDQSMGSNTPGVRAGINRYVAHFDSSTDHVAKRYIKVAKKRGHKVKMYNANVNRVIARMTPKPFYYRGVWRSNLDNAFIEFNKQGRIVSVLVRKHLYNTMGFITSDYRSSQILFGRWARILESRLNNSLLNNGYIATM